MKNKYQEALDNVNKSVCTALSCLGIDDEQSRKSLHILQELVDKEIPMKVVKWKLAQPETRCAKCGAGLERYHDYCWGCGRKVDWSDNDEN